MFFNISGFGNVTWVDPAFETLGNEGALLVFDTEGKIESSGIVEVDALGLFGLIFFLTSATSVI